MFIIVFRFVYKRTHERRCYYNNILCVGIAVDVEGGENLPVGTAP